MNKYLRCVVSGLLACLMMVMPALATSTFPDVPDSTAYAEAAEYLNDVGIMQGDTSGNFNPDKYVTRAQMAAIICRMLGETENPTTDGSRFTDVPASYWANGYIAKAAELGIINGYQDNSFKPNNTVTFEQAVKMVVSAGYGSDEAEVAGGYPNGFLFVAEKENLLNNLSTSKGLPMTRGNVALLLFNFYCANAVFE